LGVSVGRFSPAVNGSGPLSTPFWEFQQTLSVF